MRDLNYRHLYYFWTVAREGTVRAASELLHLAQPTLSSQIHTLERSLGSKLFRRSGRNLVLTEKGHTVYRYAQEIFTLGKEMINDLSGYGTRSIDEVRVGVADVVPKLIALELLRPSLELKDPAKLYCYEGKPGDLLARLAVHDLDVVLSDVPIGPDVSVRAYNHLLGESTISAFAEPALAARLRRRFPQSLQGKPALLPTESASLRRSLDQWFEREDIHPDVVAEFDDSALLKVFAQTGTGVFFAPTAIRREICRQYQVRSIGRIDDMRERFYAISVERRVTQPAVIAIANAARERVFTPD